MPLIILKVKAAWAILTSTVGLFTIAASALIIAVGLVIKEFLEFSDEAGGMSNAWKLYMLSMREDVLKFSITAIEAYQRVAKYIPGVNTLVSTGLNILKNDLALTRLEFKQLSLAGYRSGMEMGKVSEIEKELAEETAELKEEMESLGDSFGDTFKEGITSIKEIRDEIKTAYDELKTLNEDYQKNSLDEEESFRGDIVNLVLKAEEKIEDLSNDYTKAKKNHDEDEARSVKAKMDEQMAIIQRYRDTGINLATELADRREYLAMDEMSRLIKDHEYKMLMMKKEALEDQIKVLQKIVLLKQENDAAVNFIGIEKEAAINAEIAKAKTFRERLADQTEGLKTWVQESVSMYQNYVTSVNSALSNIRSSSSPSSGKYSGYVTSYQQGTSYVPETGIYGLHEGEQVIPKNKVGRSNVVNIFGGTYLSKEVALDIGDKIIERLKLQMKV